MGKREKIGVAVIVAILGVLGLIYVLTTTRPENATGDFIDNPITQRRVEILEGR
jgi:hypothetical protein